MSDLAAAVAAVAPIDERTARSVAATLARLAEPVDPFDEGASPHHLTAGAFVVSARGVILHRHQHLAVWLLPGGHVDPGETPAAAAVRETFEETGLVGRHLEPPLLFHVDEHPGPRGHLHDDLRYLLVAEPVDPVPGPGESPEVAWFDLDHALKVAFFDLHPALDALRRWWTARYVGD